MQKLTSYTPYALAALRVVAALIFIEHGTQKLFGFPAPPDGGLPEAGSLLWVGAWLELVGGAFLLFGLFTRPVAFIVSGEMAVAYWMFHAPASFYPVLNGGDAAILYTFVFLLFVFTGPGAFSLDDLNRRGAPKADAEPAGALRAKESDALIYRLLANP
jgi:putative oxidoreductase